MRRTTPIFLDSFSGALCDLKTTQRTEANAVAVLAKSPRVSTWDMETKWVRSLLNDLTRSGLIVEVMSEPYPWHRYALTNKARALLAQKD